MNERTTENRKERTETVLKQLQVERDNQVKKFGEQFLNDYVWLSVLMEEVGEVSEILSTHKDLKELNPFEATSMYNEIVHVAATAVSWLECLNLMEKQGAAAVTECEG